MIFGISDKLKELSVDLLLLSIARVSPNQHDLIRTQAQSLQPNVKD